MENILDIYDNTAFKICSASLETKLQKPSLDKIQRRTTKIPTKLSKLSYDQRLAEQGLKVLKKSERRLDVNVQNHERIGFYRNGKRLEHQRKNKRA